VREIAKMIIVLTAIAVFSGGALGFLDRITQGPIEYQRLKFVKGPAVLAVFSGFDNDPVKDYKKDVALVEKPDLVVKKSIFPAKKDGKCFAVAFQVEGQGYHGQMGIMMGIDVKTDHLTGIRIMTHTETPGLGARVTEPSFYDQFSGLGVGGVALTTKGGKIDAVSGASISSQGVVDAVKTGLALFERNKEKILKTVQAG
jgi:electron transport complex protein RnfG